MAPKRNAEAAALMEAERADREENANVNEAIARTDSEVFTDALGDEPLDDEAGTELEEMGEGLEGEELEEDEAEAEPEVEAKPEGEEETPEGEAEAEGEEAAEDEAPQPPPQQEQRPEPPSIPPRVLRAVRDQAREREDALQAQLRDLQMRLDNLSRQPPPQPQAAPQPAPAPQQAPDMFADPDGYRNWVLGEAERRAEAKFNERFAQQQAMQQRDMEMRLNDSLAQTASGPRSYEFNVAYRDLTSLDRTPENSALVRRLVAQPDPGQAILEWWEQTSNPDYIEYHRDQVRQFYAQQAQPRRAGPNGRVPLQNGSRQPQQVRHEVRLPRSLSEASGGRSQHISDAEMSDGSEESVFAYGARR